MFLHLAFLPLLLAGVNADGRTRRDSDNEIWKELQQVLPEEYAKEAELRGLNTSKIFHNQVIKLTYEQVVQETEALTARQHILQEYVECSCPKCPNNDEESKNRRKREIANPLKAIGELLVPCETELMLKTIKMLRLGLAEAQLTSQRLVSRVACSCVNADQCRGILDPLVYAIISGNKDAEMNMAYWQNSLKGFPNVLEKAFVDTLSSATTSAINYVYQRLKPKLSTPNSSAVHAPPGIFAAGQDPSYWHSGDFPIKSNCPDVHINITNARENVEITRTNFTRELDTKK